MACPFYSVYVLQPVVCGVLVFVLLHPVSCIQSLATYIHVGLRSTVPNTYRYGLPLLVCFSCELVPDPNELLDHVLLADTQAGTLFHQLAQV